MNALARLTAASTERTPPGTWLVCHALHQHAVRRGEPQQRKAVSCVIPDPVGTTAAAWAADGTM